jgi:hypothetical protein
VIRYNKYRVLKNDDISDYLTADEILELNRLEDKIYVGRLKEGRNPNSQFVCIKDTWPEYEIVWKMLEKRVDSENSIHS